MRAWLMLLGGLIVWAVHFFALYAVGSIFLTTDLARALTLLFTLACLLINASLYAASWRATASGPQDRWVRSVGLWGITLGSVAIVWQGLVALLL